MSTDSLLGRTIDDYRLLSLLGKGGMARVYLGLDERLQRYVALKIIDAPYRQDSEYLRRFEQEARAIAQLEHPHIVRLYHYGESQDLLYMVMQYVEGANLHAVNDTFRQDGEFMPLEEVSGILDEICQALDYAHQKGVIHRDIKPANIILNKQGQVILVDFGLALFTDLGSQGEVLGTPHYVAPEQVIFSADAGPASDLYAVGVILFELLTGELPFDAREPLDVAQMQVSAPVPLLRQRRPDLPPELEAVILKVLEKEPARRYASGMALATAFRQAWQSQAGPPETMPLRVTIPERVTQHHLAHPLPPVPAAIAGDSSGMIDSMTHNRSVLAMSGCLGAIFLVCLILTGSLLLWERRATAVADLPPLTEPSLTATITPTVVGTPTVRPTASPTATSTVTPVVTLYELLIARRGDDSMFIVNTGSQALPLAPLQVGAGRGAISGDEWELTALAVGECVTVWKDSGQPRAPNVFCEQVGQRLTRPGRERFWDDDFTVLYHGEEVGSCRRRDELCLITINSP